MVGARATDVVGDGGSLCSRGIGVLLSQFRIAGGDVEFRASCDIAHREHSDIGKRHLKWVEYFDAKNVVAKRERSHRMAPVVGAEEIGDDDDEAPSFRCGREATETEREISPTLAGVTESGEHLTGERL